MESGYDVLTFEYENLGDGDQDPVSIMVCNIQLL